MACTRRQAITWTYPHLSFRPPRQTSLNLNQNTRFLSTKFMRECLLHSVIHFVQVSTCYLNRDHFVYATSQWETTLHCNVVSHWRGKRIPALEFPCACLQNPHSGGRLQRGSDFTGKNCKGVSLISIKLPECVFPDHVKRGGVSCVGRGQPINP